MNQELLGRLGPYLLLEEVAQGNFTRIFQAHAENLLGKTVAIKKLKVEYLDDQAPQLALKNEVRILSRLNHPGILKVFEYGEAGTELYSVLEYVEGWNLQTLIGLQRQKNKNFREWFSVWIVTELCRILHYLHRTEITHGDIEAKNILLTSEGYVKLVDFTKAAPAEDATRRQDLFSCGALFYELLTGEKWNQKNLKNFSQSGLSDELRSLFMNFLDRESGMPYPQANELYKSLAIYMHLRFPGLISADIADYLTQITKAPK